ncbi:N-alpha-acetyltransferase 30 [Bifiguratus adelaidae]|uniref:N-terminal methionine N(alpha)-acetyltransferase NatC n=1 Tax=Bifiguratus adelaidae TaxID=1938954 RepID=A0A261Y8D1_9FUNG|nr:N-alpha-acetyltransferase 30 [Bifiguratus adelaidae]
MTDTDAKVVIDENAIVKKDDQTNISYIRYQCEAQLKSLIKLIENDLSEPYSIYTYRYFIHQWPNLCFLAMDGDECVGVIICKLDSHKDRLRGYIAMLAVAKDYRKRRIGSTLVKLAIDEMKANDADEIVLETELTNVGALSLYHRLGFIRDKRLFRYYLNGVDAFRLKLFPKTMTESHRAS